MRVLSLDLDISVIGCYFDAAFMANTRALAWNSGKLTSMVNFRQRRRARLSSACGLSNLEDRLTIFK